MSLNWKFRDDGNNQWASFEAGHFKLSVTDQDGDGSVWSLEYRDVDLVSFKAQYDEGDKYHFDIALEKAERAFRIAFDQKELLLQIDKFIDALAAPSPPASKAEGES